MQCSISFRMVMIHFGASILAVLPENRPRELRGNEYNPISWENDYIESFNGKLRDELLDREIYTTLEEAKVLIEQWRREYNQVCPHSALKYQNKYKRRL